MSLAAVEEESKYSLIDEPNLDFLCRDEGWDLPELADLLKLDLGYHRSRKGNYRFKFPSHVNFVLLNAASSPGVLNYSSWSNFALGIRRTDADPKKGRIWVYWSEYPYEDIDEFEKRDESLTVYTELNIHSDSRDSMMIGYTQAATVPPNYKSSVSRQLGKMRGGEIPTGAGSIDTRIRNLRKNSMPWAYADRSFLLGAALLWFADRLNVSEVQFPSASNVHSQGEADHFINQRIVDYVSGHTHWPGIQIVRYDHEETIIAKANKNIAKELFFFL